MHQEKRYVLSLIIRVLLCFMPINFFEVILTPLTVYLIYWLLLPFGASLSQNTIIISDDSFNFISACIAPSMYYLFWVLVMLTRNIKLLIRVKLIACGFLALFGMNILRIVVLILISVYAGQSAFQSIHFLWWKFMSGAYVALVWIFLIKLFKIDSIPIYDDMKELIGFARKNNN